MQAKRQTIQLELALGAALMGEAQIDAPQGTEVGVARAASEHPVALLGPSMEGVVAPSNVKKALARVRRNKGAPGIDGMTVRVFPGARMAPGRYEHPCVLRRVPTYSPSVGSDPAPLSAVVFSEQPDKRVARKDVRMTAGYARG